MCTWRGSLGFVLFIFLLVCFLFSFGGKVARAEAETSGTGALDRNKALNRTGSKEGPNA